MRNVLWAPFYSWGNQLAEKLSNLSKVTQQAAKLRFKHRSYGTCLSLLRLLQQNTIHWVGGLNNTHLLLPVLQAGKSKTKVCADSAPGESSFPRVMVMWSSCCVLTWQSKQALASLLLIRTPIPSWGSTLMTSSEPHYLPKAPTPNIITLGVKVSKYEFCRERGHKL